MKSLRILFNAYPTHCQGGGAVVKMRKLREYLTRAGHQVDFYDPWSTRIEDYDIYHHFSFFAVDLPMLRFAKAAGVKIVVETMYWASLRHALTSPANGLRGRAKMIVKHLLKLSAPSLLPERRVLELADCLMPNSETEARLLAAHYRIPRDRMCVVPNAADRRFAEATPDLFVERFGLRDFVLTTGMFEPRKNQLNLIRALKGTNIPLVLIGGCPGVHRHYYEACRRETNGHTHFIDHLDHDDPLLASAYAAARVLALPSWHETTGKSALEAALAGANIVMTTYAPGAREYFDGGVFYVDPGDVAGIRRAILRALEAPPNSALRRRVQENFVWENVAAIRQAAYQGLLAK